MPNIQAFRGVRYDLGHVGSLSDVVCPPYDVIDPAFQDALYKRHPSNYIRLELNRDEPGDDQQNNRYSRAAKHLRNWRREGVLQDDPNACVYVYHQTFSDAGREYTRRGFISRVRLEKFGEGRIYPHEETHASAKQDRFNLTVACKANLSPIFGLYPDPETIAQDILERAAAEQQPLIATDHLGVIHKLWPVSDTTVVSELQRAMSEKPVFIADGHHRYETGLNYREHLLKEQGSLPENHPANYVLMTCVSMSDPGMIVLPTHRLFRGIPAMTSDELKSKLGALFSVRIAGEGSDLANLVWQEIETGGEQEVLGFFTAADERWSVCRITDAGRRRMAELSADHGEDWQGLGVSILHRLVMDDLLGAKNLPKPMYVHSVQEVIDGLDQGDTVGRDATGQMGSGGRFELACLVMPATVDHVRRISEVGERMPAKSTYFYPKLLSGLVINPLE